MTKTESRSAKRDFFSCLILGFLGSCFILGTACNLNGTSVAAWNQVLCKQDNSGVLFSKAKPSRDDEWEAWTPALVAQTREGFPATNPSLGFGKVPLIYNLPVKHYTMIFRPQFWGFFLFDVEHGYAWYWNAKLFGALAGIFLLAKGIGFKTPSALLSCVAIVYSSYAQWWFSSPTMLPEMLTNWALMTLCCIRILMTQRLRAAIPWAFGLTYFLTAFCLSQYPAYQVPMVYLSALIVIGTVFKDPHRNMSPIIPSAIIAASILLTAAILTPMIIECAPALHRLAGTVYPGSRRHFGGGLNLDNIFSGVLSFCLSEENFPDSAGVPTAAANFYPLWFCALVVWLRQKGSGRYNLLCRLLAGYMLALALYMIVPWPAWLCRITLMQFSTPIRALLPLGVAGTLLASTVLERDRDKPKQGRSDLLFAALTAILITGYLASLRSPNPTFLSTRGFMALLTTNILICSIFFLLKTRVAAPLLASVFFISSLATNPVMSGLEPLTANDVVVEVRRIHNQSPESSWLVYEDNALSQLIMSTGAQVVSGLKIVPDLEFYEKADSERKHLDKYNRYSFAYFAMPASGDMTEILGGAFPSHVVIMHPSCHALRARDTRFFVFRGVLEDAETHGLNLISAIPQNRVWIYEYSPI